MSEDNFGTTGGALICDLCGKSVSDATCISFGKYRCLDCGARTRPNIQYQILDNGAFQRITPETKRERYIRLVDSYITSILGNSNPAYVGASRDTLLRAARDLAKETIKATETTPFDQDEK